MIIGINAAAAVKQPRTGVEEYAYQLIKHLTMLPEAGEHRFLLFAPYVKLAKGGVFFDFDLPENFTIQELRWPLPMWTQLRLGMRMLKDKPDALFIPVHILPTIHPKNSTVTLHGLEYEFYPELYPSGFLRYLRFSTKYALKHAAKIISVSENTKKDLVRLYSADASKIEVVHHGTLLCHSREGGLSAGKAGNPEPGSRVKPGMTKKGEPYLLYVGRIELKKNLLGIIEAYKILKEKYNIPHELILAGGPGFGYEIIKLKIENSKLKIKLLGYVSEEKKRQLYAGASVFLFPSFYEGFGIPIIEAQAAGVPVVSSNNSCIPEVAGQSALLVDPKNPEQIAEAIRRIIDDKALCDKLIRSGFENIKRFNWEKCARETLKILVK